METARYYQQRLTNAARRVRFEEAKRYAQAAGFAMEQGYMLLHVVDVGHTGCISAYLSIAYPAAGTYGLGD